MVIDRPPPRSLGDATGRDSVRRPHVSIGVIHLGILTEQLLLAGLVSQVSSDEIAVLLGLQEGDQVDAGPHLLAGQLAGGGVSEKVKGKGIY